MRTAWISGPVADRGDGLSSSDLLTDAHGSRAEMRKEVELPRVALQIEIPSKNVPARHARAWVVTGELDDGAALGGDDLRPAPRHDVHGWIAGKPGCGMRGRGADVVRADDRRKEAADPM